MSGTVGAMTGPMYPTSDERYATQGAIPTKVALSPGALRAILIVALLGTMLVGLFVSFIVRATLDDGSTTTTARPSGLTPITEPAAGERTVPVTVRYDPPSTCADVAATWQVLATAQGDGTTELMRAELRQQWANLNCQGDLP